MPLPISRRDLLSRTACGFGALALAGLASEAQTADSRRVADPLAPKLPHHPRRAKRVIFLFLHCGSTNSSRPRMVSWVLYGLGTENRNLPGFVSIAPSAGNGGPRNYGNAFLPAIYQGTPVGKAGGSGAEATIRDLTSSLPPA